MGSRWALRCPFVLPFCCDSSKRALTPPQILRKSKDKWDAWPGCSWPCLFSSLPSQSNASRRNADASASSLCGGLPPAPTARPSGSLLPSPGCPRAGGSPRRGGAQATLEISPGPKLRMAKSPAKNLSTLQKPQHLQAAVAAWQSLEQKVWAFSKALDSSHPYIFEGFGQPYKRSIRLQPFRSQLLTWPSSTGNTPKGCTGRCGAAAATARNRVNVPSQLFVFTDRPPSQQPQQDGGKGQRLGHLPQRRCCKTKRWLGNIDGHVGREPAAARPGRG